MPQEETILALVLPCYHEEAVLPDTVEQLSSRLDDWIGKGIISAKSFMLFVNDGSRDRTWQIIEHYHGTNKYVCGINLAANVGHQNALMAGLTYAKDVCDIAISIDADLQDDLNALEQMIIKYHEGCDIVYGVKKNRKVDSLFKRITAKGFYKLMHELGVKSIYNHADCRLMSKRALIELSKYQESNLFLRGIVPLIGYKTDCVYYDIVDRKAGESKYTLSKMLNFAIDGITSFSVKPVRLVFALGIVFIFIALAISIYSLFDYFYGNPVPGFTSLILSIWFCSGCILLGMGIIGEYVGKIYIESKHRPKFNIEQVLIHK